MRVLSDDCCGDFLQREVAEHIVAALDAGGGSMDQLCRLLLAADSYSVVLLRNYCLAGLAQAFHSLDNHTSREQATFEAFVDAVAPKVSHSLTRLWLCIQKEVKRKYEAYLCLQ